MVLVLLAQWVGALLLWGCGRGREGGEEGDREGVCYKAHMLDTLSYTCRFQIFHGTPNPLDPSRISPSDLDRVSLSTCGSKGCSKERQKNTGKNRVPCGMGKW